MSISSYSDQFEFTPEQIRVLRSQPGQALHVSVAETNKVYLLVEEGTLSALDEEYIRQGLAHAANQVAQGVEEEWDPEQIKAAGRELLARRNSGS
jgi:hypothetical protein